jgi:hypothetical protein
MFASIPEKCVASSGRCWGILGTVLLFLLSVLLAAPDDSLPPTWDGTPLLHPSTIAKDSSGPGNLWAGTPPRDTVGAPWLTEIKTYPHRILTLAFTPLDWVLRPTFGLISQPLRPMIRYADSAELIQKGNALMRLGNDSGSTVLFPIATLTGNSSSRAGIRYRQDWTPEIHSNVALRWSPSEEWGIWGSGSAANFPFGLNTGVNFLHYRTPEEPIWIPGTAYLSPTDLPAGNVSETLDQIEVGIGHGITDHTGLEGVLQYAHHSIGLPQRFSDRLPISGIPWLDGASGEDRGTVGTSQSGGFGARLNYSDQDHEGTPTSGGAFHLDAMQKVSTTGGAMASLNMSGTQYLLLGQERYVFRKADLEPYLNLDPSTILQVIDPTTLWQRLTDRRVVALFWSFQHGWDDGSQPAPWYFIPTIGGQAPARAYDNRLTNMNLLGGGIEYRWPIWKYLDGSIFAEAVESAANPWDFPDKGFAPGWGLGIRVRTEGSFFFRFQIAQGRAGSTYYLTTAPEF